MQKDEILDEEIGINEIIQSIKSPNSPKRILILGDYKQGKRYTLNEINCIFNKSIY